jgi:alpha-glucosidase
MNRDDQQMVDWYHRVVALAAQHHLMIDFHGAYKPDGLRRTYPNLITREGVMGKEYLKWSARTSPVHNTTLPFTRMLAGPLDYTPGAFGNSNRENFVARNLMPMGLGTRAHELALYVVLESPLMMVSDYPEHYAGQHDFEFIKQVPTTWDEVRVLDGRPRENSSRWLVAAARTGSSAPLRTGMRARSRFLLDFWVRANTLLRFTPMLPMPQQKRPIPPSRSGPSIGTRYSTYTWSPAAATLFGFIPSAEPAEPYKTLRSSQDREIRGL